MRTFLFAILVFAIAACVAIRTQSTTPTVQTCTSESCEFGPYTYGKEVYFFPSAGGRGVSLGYQDYPSDKIRGIFASVYGQGLIKLPMAWRLVDRTNLSALKALCASHQEAQRHEGCRCAWTLEDANSCGRVVGGDMVFTLRPMDTEVPQKDLPDCNGEPLQSGINAMVTNTSCGLVLVADVLDAPPRCLQASTREARKVVFASTPGEEGISHLAPKGQSFAEYVLYRTSYGEGYPAVMCPLKPRDNACYEGPDEACVVYAGCLEVCRDPRSGKLLWP